MSDTLSANIVPVLEMQHIRKAFPGVRVLDDVSLTIRPGEVHALMGENGAGKSTLMKILAGALRADEGRILLGGQPVEITTPQQAMELGIGIIYQELNLAPHLSVAENIFLGREPRLFPGWIDSAKMQRDARALMENLGMRLDVRTLVGQLTIAQRQMVEIAKATSRNVRVLAMDEPSATLTSHELENLWRLIRQLQAQGIGIIYISHRMDEVFQIADTVTVLRDGHMVGSNPLVTSAAKTYCASWLDGRSMRHTRKNTPPTAGLSWKSAVSDAGACWKTSISPYTPEKSSRWPVWSAQVAPRSPAASSARTSGAPARCA